MVREKRTSLEQQLSHLSNEFQNFLQVHVSEYQQSNTPQMYLNSNMFNYNAGQEGEGVIVDEDLESVGVEVLTPGELEEMRARSNGVPIESLLEAPPSYAPLSKETVALNVYPPNIVNPEESVAKTPDFVYDTLESESSDPGHFIDDGSDRRNWRT